MAELSVVCFSSGSGLRRGCDFPKFWGLPFIQLFTDYLKRPTTCRALP